MTKALLPLILLIFFSFCSPKNELFNQTFISSGNSEYDHLFELLYNNFDSLEIIRTDLANLDVSLGIGGFREEKFLFGLDEYLFNYNHDSYELLLLTQFLRIKYNSTNELYDEMLRACIRLNSKNYDAMYILAKLRYRNGLYESSFPLVKHLYLSNQKHMINNEYLFFVEKMGFDKNKNILLDEILAEKVYYLN